MTYRAPDENLLLILDQLAPGELRGQLSAAEQRVLTWLAAWEAETVDALLAVARRRTAAQVAEVAGRLRAAGSWEQVSTLQAELDQRPAELPAPVESVELVARKVEQLVLDLEAGDPYTEAVRDAAQVIRGRGVQP